MSLFSNIIGFTIFGLSIRSLQLGIQKRPQFKDIKGYLGYALTGAIVGHWLYQVEEKQYTAIKQKKKF
ncbi:hypothetical protein T552_01866 [Pneumocystis carinii B80]|uniref:Uncharacterized protein n=1 Tax=Pneumocystis carinii (strain B80) TaxID=1408658 RepID=A0A0W4ZI12_PNEC8|nr:hypothetical protein T552_01866 [Pneumocystis carinii B80]KTW28002.1 hypothetical protein T552_01866 [Pneumocystis carinii B80]